MSDKAEVLRQLRKYCELVRGEANRNEAKQPIETLVGAWERGRISAMSDVLFLIDEMENDA